MKYACGLLAAVLLTGVLFAQAPTAAVLQVQGDIGTPLSLTAEDLSKMSRETVSVPAPDGTKIAYEGVTLLEILQKAGAPFGKQLRGKALVTYVLAKAHDGYQVAFTLGEVDPQFGNQSILEETKSLVGPNTDKTFN